MIIHSICRAGHAEVLGMLRRDCAWCLVPRGWNLHRG